MTYAKQTSLDGKYTVFGRLIDGFETLEKLEKEAVGKNNRPLNEERMAIEDVTIHANPIADMDYEDMVEKNEEEAQKGDAAVNNEEENVVE